jgi:hypothetical protein
VSFLTRYPLGIAPNRIGEHACRVRGRRYLRPNDVAVVKLLEMPAEIDRINTFATLKSAGEP